MIPTFYLFNYDTIPEAPTTDKAGYENIDELVIPGSFLVQMSLPNCANCAFLVMHRKHSLTSMAQQLPY